MVGDQMGFLGDSVRNPDAAIKRLNESRSFWKSVFLFLGIGMVQIITFILSHFILDYFALFWAILILGILGILFEFFFVIGFILELYAFLKLTGYKPAGETSKTVAWCVLIPSCIFYIGLFLLTVILISAGAIEITGYLYDVLKYLLYIWILSLAIYAVTQYQPEHKSRNILGVLGIFSFNYIIWSYLNYDFLQGIFKLLAG
jgi:hypothetical protein